MSKYEDLERLGRLLDAGKITQEEFDQLKQQLLEEDDTSRRKHSTTSSTAVHRAGEALGKKVPGVDKALPSAQAKKSSTGTGCLFVIAVVIFLAIAGVCSGDNGGGSGGGGQSSGHDPLEAYVICQQFVEDRLKAPSTAEFGGPYSQVTTHNGGGEYTVDTYVDAENSFGAMIRNDFVCTVQHTSGDTYRLVSLDMG